MQKLEKQWTKRLKLHAKGNKLLAEGDMLLTEGDMLFAEGILSVYGNITLEWIFRNGDHDCKLENGELYKWREEKEKL